MGVFLLPHLSPEGRGRRTAPGEGFSGRLVHGDGTAAEPLTPPSPLKGEGAIVRCFLTNLSPFPNPMAQSRHLPGYGGAAATSVREVSGGDVAVSLRFESGRTWRAITVRESGTVPKTGNPEAVIVS